MKISPRSLIMGLVFAGLFFVCLTQTASADNTTGVYTVQTPQGNYSVTYSSFPNGMRTFTISKPGQVTTQYRVSSTGPYWEMKVNGSIVLTITSPNGPGDALISSSACSTAFYWSEGLEDPSLFTSPCMSTIRSYLQRDRDIVNAMSVWCSDANLVWAGYALGYHETQSRIAPTDISSQVIVQPPGSVMYWNDTWAGCVAACEISFFGCSSEAMCILGCETRYRMRATGWRQDCPGVLESQGFY